ncbi:MAG: hypothetical protein V4676_12620, partial [Bacteroidota bacterium]
MKLTFTLAAAAVVYHLPLNAQSINQVFENPPGVTTLTTNCCFYSTVNYLPLQHLVTAKTNKVFFTKGFVHSTWLLNFSATKVQNKVELKWTIAENEKGLQFEIEKSNEGNTFSTIEVLPTTKRTGIEAYRFVEKNALLTKAYYR